MTQKIEWTDNDSSASYYGAGLEFCHVTDENIQCGPFSTCKDYMQDAILCVLHKKSMLSEACYITSGKNHPSIHNVSILMANAADGNLRSKMDNVADFLHQIEDHLKIPRSIFTEVSNPPRRYIRGGVFLVKGDKRWVNSPVMLSFYTLILRSGQVHTVGKPFMETIEGFTNKTIATYQSYDYSRWEMGKPGIAKILKYGDQKIFYGDITKNYPENVQCDITHSYMGICGFSQGNSPVPHWYRDLDNDILEIPASKKVKGAA